MTNTTIEDNAEETAEEATIVHPDRHGTARRTTFGYLTDDHPKLDRFQNAISAACGIIAAIAVLGMAVVTLGEIAARSILNSPLGWSVAFVENILLPAAAFFGIVTAYRSGAHVAVVSVFERMNTVGRKAALLISYVLLLVGFSTLTVTGLTAALFAFQNGEGPAPGSAELLIPDGIWKSMVPISMGLGFALVAIDLWREITAPWTRVATDYEPGDSIDQALAEADVTDLEDITKRSDTPS